MRAQTWQDQTAGFYSVVVDSMLRTGFNPDEIAKIGGGNFLRVSGEALRKQALEELQPDIFGVGL